MDAMVKEGEAAKCMGKQSTATPWRGGLVCLLDETDVVQTRGTPEVGMDGSQSEV